MKDKSETEGRCARYAAGSSVAPRGAASGKNSAYDAQSGNAAQNVLNAPQNAIKGKNTPKYVSTNKMGGAQRSVFALKEYIILFFAVIAGATVAMFSGSAIDAATGGNKAVTAAVTAAILVVLSAVLTVCAALYRRHTTQKPLKTILLATKKMAGGEFDVNLKPRHIWGRYDEYDVIMENINLMAEELSKNEMLRSDFIANVSHEIKTPLSVIQSYASALCGGGLSEERKAEYYSVLLSASRRLTALVTDILRLNKLENQKIFPGKTELEAGEVLRGCVLGYMEKAEEKEIELCCEIDDVKLLSDEGLLEVVFNNLLSNAVKFTPRGGRIFVGFSAAEGGARLVVSDNGCGMTAEVGAHIFDKFYQGDTSHSQEGNGLGLALVKRVIDLLGGEICVESRPGEGSTSTVFLR